MPLDLELSDIDASYGEMPALFDVSVAVPRGSVTALLGPNGAGKTTSLRVATGLLRPRRGRIHLKGHDVTKAGIRELAARGLCMIPEGRGIFPTLTVKENLLIQTHLKGRGTTAQIQDRAYSQFPVLAERRSQLAGTLSGGEQQMLALTRALTTNPSVVLLDEISMGLAPLIVEQLFAVVRQLATDGTTILLVEQLAQDALEIADYVFVLNQGRLRAVGEPDDVRAVILGSYLGETNEAATPRKASDAGASPMPTSKRPGEDLWVKTPKGSLAHRRTCVVSTYAAEVYPVDVGNKTKRCGLCADGSVGP